MGGQITERASWLNIINAQNDRNIIKKKECHYKVVIFFVAIDEFDVPSKEPHPSNTTTTIPTSNSSIRKSKEFTKLDDALEVFGKVNNFDNIHNNFLVCQHRNLR